MPGLVAALLTGCAAGVEGSGSTGTSQSAAPTAAPATVAPTSSGPPAPSASPTPAGRTIAVSCTGGQVTGTSGREEVSAGDRVVLRITSDVAEEVHVHGYDLSRPVPAGGTVDIPVEARIPGVFEVELHQSGRVLFQLRVS